MEGHGVGHTVRVGKMVGLCVGVAVGSAVTSTVGDSVFCRSLVCARECFAKGQRGMMGHMQ